MKTCACAVDGVVILFTFHLVFLLFIDSKSFFTLLLEGSLSLVWTFWLRIYTDKNLLRRHQFDFEFLIIEYKIIKWLNFTVDE